MTLQEERDALQKRLDEIDDVLYGAEKANIEPLHMVVQNFLPEGWRVVGPEAKTYDWSQAPDWANWVAMDRDGEVYWLDGF